MFGSSDSAAGISGGFTRARSKHSSALLASLDSHLSPSGCVQASDRFFQRTTGRRSASSDTLFWASLASCEFLPVLFVSRPWWSERLGVWSDTIGNGATAGLGDRWTLGGRGRAGGSHSKYPSFDNPSIPIPINRGLLETDHGACFVFASTRVAAVLTAPRTPFSTLFTPRYIA